MTYEGRPTVAGRGGGRDAPKWARAVPACGYAAHIVMTQSRRSPR